MNVPAPADDNACSSPATMTPRYLVDRPYVCVEGVPSVQLAAQLEKEEAARIAKQAR